MILPRSRAARRVEVMEERRKHDMLPNFGSKRPQMGTFDPKLVSISGTDDIGAGVAQPASGLSKRYWG